jgi:hypothetical protein
MPYRTRGDRARSPIIATTPASTVPTCVGPPYRNARIRSRRSPGTVLITASHVLDAPPWSQTTCANRNARSIANVEATVSTPKARR